MQSLEDVLIHQLQDLHSANMQAVKATRDLATAATSDDLKRALERGVYGIEDGSGKLEKMIRAHGSDPDGVHCKGMEGLVREARANALEEDFSQDSIRDAVIIVQYQQMVHYAIAGYGCAAAFARRLGLSDEEQTLGEMLDAAHSGDATMSEIAAEIQ